MSLPEFWFVLIAVLWGGYFVLEGFDFGVGMLLPVLGRNDDDRRAMFQSIGPVWDGNEVWLVVAGGATFAAFPAWYGTMFSGFYIALVIVLLCLMLRVVSFEWRERGDSERWRAFWRWMNTLGSAGASLVWGIALANLVYGVPLDSNHDFSGSFFDLFNWYTLLGGLTAAALFVFHGATYLTIRTSGDLWSRAAASARLLAVPALVLGSGFYIATVAVAADHNHKDAFPPLLPAILGILVLVGAVMTAWVRRSGWSFACTAAAALAFVATVFTSLYPRVMVSSPDFGNSLTIQNAASGHYALQVMTVVAVIFTPLVLLYQGWTYHVFRARIAGHTPAAE
jgi:cytochrome d ubiquinol oxidase subunit II